VPRVEKAPIIDYDTAHQLATKKGLSHLAQNKNTKTSKEKRPFFRPKECEKALFLGRNPFGFRFLYVFFSRDFALWRTLVRRRRQNRDFCI
jgi:hypothetical protein